MRTAASLPVHDHGSHVIVEMPREIDVSNRDTILEQLLAVLDSRPDGMIVDMGGTVFCDSSGVNLLVNVYRRARSVGSEMCVAVSHDHVRKVLRVSGLERAVAVYEELSPATAAFPRAAPSVGGHGPPAPSGETSHGR